MCVLDPTTTLFVVERYDETGNAEHLPPLPSLAGVQVVMAISVPADDVVLALIQAPDEQAVRTSLAGVGWPVDRITPAVPARRGDAGTS